jgi:hypothetical protein
MAKRDETMGYIIRGDPNRDTVPSHHPNMMPSHFPTEFGKNLDTIIRKGDRVSVTFADVNNSSFYLDQITSCHSTPSLPIVLRMHVTFYITCREDPSQTLKKPYPSGSGKFNTRIPMGGRRQHTQMQTAVPKGNRCLPCYFSRPLMRPTGCSGKRES